MSELENIKPVAFYRADWKGDMMFRKDNTVVIRKNEGDFTTGWIKPLYDELPEPQPQLTIPKSIADELDQIYEDTEEYQKNVAQMLSTMQPYFVLESYPEILHWLEDDVKNTNVALAYLAGKALGVDLVKVVEG